MAKRTGSTGIRAQREHNVNWHDLSSPETLKKIEKLARYLNQEQMADVLGIHDRTLRKKFAEDARILAAYKRGKGGAVSDTARCLMKNVRKGNVIAQIFMLKTQAGWREKDREPPRDPEEQVARIREALDAMDETSAAK